MATLLISDLHLDPSRPAALEAFVRLCAGPARDVSDLYILGDLFEAWIGDDDDAEPAARVADALAGVSAGGVRVAFQHGNRDFLLGGRFAERCGMRLLPESAVETIEGQPTLLLHGDTLCLDDAAYLAFRAQVRTGTWQTAFLARSLAERRAFAAAARAESARHTAGAAAVLMDVAPRAVTAALTAHGVRLLVHGHTHRPALHAFDLDGTAAKRIVLPDWYDAAAGLWIDGDDLRFISFD